MANHGVGVRSGIEGIEFIILNSKSILINTRREDVDVVQGPRHYAVPIALNSLRSKQT